MKDKLKKRMGPKEVAKRWGYHPNTIYNYIKRGIMPEPDVDLNGCFSWTKGAVQDIEKTIFKPRSLAENKRNTRSARPCA